MLFHRSVRVYFLACVFLTIASAQGAPPADNKPSLEAGASGIRSSPLKADMEERPLPATVENACVGGGGRYFILLLPSQRSLAIFDVNEAKVVKYLSLADDNVRFAASLEKLFVVYPDRNILQRFDLATYQKEITVQIPFDGKVKAITTGSAAAGPLLVHFDKGGEVGNSPVTFLDPVTIRELKLGGVAETGGVVRHSTGDVYHYRASPDGSVFGGWVTSHSQSMSSIVLSDNSASVYQGPMAGSVVPAMDNTLVTAGGLYTKECKLRGGDKAEPRFRLRVPAQTGPFYVTCPGGGGAQHNTGKTDTTRPVDVYLAGDDRPIATLQDVELPTSNEAWTGSDFTQDKRVLFVPEAKLIAIIPKSNDRLILHRFDVEKTLKNGKLDYLFVVSRPPAVAYKGTPFAYTPQAWSRKGGVKVKLDSGPEGMQVAASGKVTWHVPKDFAETQAVTILTVSDGSGQEIFHTFKVAVREAPSQ